MSDPANVRSEKGPARIRFRFSLSTLLLVVTIAGLATALFLTQRKLSQIESEVAAHQPLSVQEVARQFQKHTSVSPLTVTVNDVRYSPKEDSYQVSFSWTDSTAKQNPHWSTDVKLVPDGFGRYIGKINNGPFITPLGYTNFFPVMVETPSAFQR